MNLQHFLQLHSGRHQFPVLVFYREVQDRGIVVIFGIDPIRPLMFASRSTGCCKCNVTFGADAKKIGNDQRMNILRINKVVRMQPASESDVVNAHPVLLVSYLAYGTVRKRDDNIVNDVGRAVKTDTPCIADQIAEDPADNRHFSGSVRGPSPRDCFVLPAVHVREMKMMPTKAWRSPIEVAPHSASKKHHPIELLRRETLEKRRHKYGAKAVRNNV